MSFSISNRKNFATATATCAVMMAALMAAPSVRAQQEQMPGTVNGSGSRLNGGEQSQAQPQSGGATAPGAVSNTGVSPTIAPQNTNVNGSPGGPVYPGLTPNPALSLPSGSAVSNQTGAAPTRPARSVNAGGTPQMQNLPLPPGMSEF